jgi:pyruvate dehydrogenase E1 component beta subunit
VTVLSYREAVARALAAEMEHDDSVILLGEDVAAAGGVFKTTEGLLDQFGPLRVRDTPISEQAIVGCALGAAISGLRPVAELMFADFAGVCFDPIANQVAKYRYTTDGQASVSLVLRLANGGGVGFGSQHSQSVENWFLNVPGLKLCVPGTPGDLYGLLRSAVRDDDPVLVFEHKGLYSHRGELPDEGDGLVPLGVAEIVREGDAVTVVATQLMRHRTLDAAERLAEEGIEVELIDPRTLVPLDLATILDSLKKTGRLTVVEECSPTGSWGESVIAQALEQAFEEFDARPLLISGDATPIPYAGPLEEAWLPSVDRIVEQVRTLVHE